MSLPRPPREAEYVTDWYLGVVTAAHRSIAMIASPRHYYRFHDSNASHSEPDRWKRSARAMLEWLASLDLLDASQRADVLRRAALLAGTAGDRSPRRSLLVYGKQLARGAVSRLTCHAYRHPAYLR